MEGLLIKWTLRAVVIYHLAVLCLGAEVKIFTVETDHGFANHAKGRPSSYSLEIIFISMFETNENYTFKLDQETTNLKTYKQYYGEQLVQGSKITVQYTSNGTYNGNISGSIRTKLETDLPDGGGTDEDIDVAGLTQQALGAVNEAMRNNASDVEPTIKTYIKTIGSDHYSNISFTAKKVFAVSFLMDNVTEPSCPCVEIVKEGPSYTTVGVTDALEKMEMNGYGGNEKIGKYEWGSMAYEHRPLHVTPSSDGNCFLKNSHVDVDSGLQNAICSFDYHETFYEECNPGQSWDLDVETYGQAHDALGFATALYEMLDVWYNDTGLVVPCPVSYICTHYHTLNIKNYDNAFYIPGTCNTYFGSGSILYPLASLDVVGHEIAHAYTHFSSGLVYSDCQSGSLNEAFSDMMGETLEAYLRQSYNNDWYVGFDLMKGKLGSFFGNRDALRYFKDPTHDKVSIDCAKDFYSLNPSDPHWGSGVFNKAFYILSNKCNWSIRRAFAVFLRANHYYWGSTFGYYHAAYYVWYCAYANDVPGYSFSAEDANDVVDAFVQVGIIVKCPDGFWMSSFSTLHPECPMDDRTSCFKIVNDVASWADAKEYCDELGADLLTIDTTSEESLMEHIIKSYPGDHHLTKNRRGFWIGGIDVQTESSWKTDKGEPLPSYGQFKYQQVQKCFAVRRKCFSYSCNDWGWFDDGCYRKKPFICELRSCRAGCNKHNN